MRRTIQITHDDMERLRRMVDGLKTRVTPESGNVDALENELDRAQIVDATAIRPDVITLNSAVRIRDLDTGKVMDYEIVYPNTKPRGNAYGLSVLAPLGTALLGYRAGDIVEWHVPKGQRRLKVMEVLYRAESTAKTSAA
jgi:regulator of nucleoside diphosphate kinase